MQPLHTSIKTETSHAFCEDFAAPALAHLTPVETGTGGGLFQANDLGHVCSTIDQPEKFDRLAPKSETANRSKPLYTDEQRARRDASVWTLVQAILAPIQFVVFLISLGLVGYYLSTGKGYEAATISILIKTFLLYTIMITGSIWEKVVFGEWLFVEAFFWEDVFSMLVLALQTLYVAALLNGWWTPEQQVYIAVAAYATYVINAGQFLWKLRQARREVQGVSPMGGSRADDQSSSAKHTANRWAGQES